MRAEHFCTSTTAEFRYNHLDGDERAGCFASYVFLVSRNCCVALPSGVMGLSAVCGCGIS